MDYKKEAATPFNTPDLYKLEDKKNHLLFDCGRIDMRRHIACAGYSVQRMSMFIRNRDNIVIPVRVPELPKARLAGTVYIVTTEDLVKLDKMHKNRVSFERKHVDVYVPFRDEHGEAQVMSDIEGLKDEPVWFYHAISDAWVESIELDRPKYNVPRSHPDYRLANRYVHNDHMFNNHYRYSSFSAEDLRDLPPPRVSNETVAEYVHRKNAEAVKRTLMQRMFPHREMNRFKKQQVR